MLNQVFAVVPQGLIESGTVSYVADETTGTIAYSESILAGVSIFTETVASSGNLSVDPKLLLSKSMLMGLVVNMGTAQLKVADRDDVKKLATVIVTIQDETTQLAGEATVSIAGLYISITDVCLQGTVQGHSVTIELTPNLKEEMN